MEPLGERLVHLLAGDVVRLECEELAVTAEVLENEQGGHAGVEGGATARHTVRFMPIGEDATAVTADRFRVAVDPAEDGEGWAVGAVVAEVFDEDQLAYVAEPRGALVDLEVLGQPG